MTGASLFTLKHADGGSGTPRLDPLLSSNRAAGAKAVRGISGPRENRITRLFDHAANPVKINADELAVPFRDFAPRELANGVGDPAPHELAAVIVLRGKLVAARSAFLKGLVAVALEHEVGGAPDVDLGYHGNRRTF